MQRYCLYTVSLKTRRFASFCSSSPITPAEFEAFLERTGPRKGRRRASRGTVSGSRSLGSAPRLARRYQIDAPRPSAPRRPGPAGAAAAPFSGPDPTAPPLPPWAPEFCRPGRRGWCGVPASRVAPTAIERPTGTVLWWEEGESREHFAARCAEARQTQAPPPVIVEPESPFVRWRLPVGLRLPLPLGPVPIPSDAIAVLPPRPGITAPAPPPVPGPAPTPGVKGKYCLYSGAAGVSYSICKDTPWTHEEIQAWLASIRAGTAAPGGPRIF